MSHGCPIPNRPEGCHDRAAAPAGLLTSGAGRPHGAGAPLLQALEALAEQAGYTRLVCETRRVNTRAVTFYLRGGWRETEPYGQYIGRPEAVCFSKEL